MAWKDRHGDYASTIQPGTAPSSFTVEKALSERLETLRESIIREAEHNNWDANTVDRMLTDSGLPPMTKEYIVFYTETVAKEVRVRARDSAHAPEVAGIDGPGLQLTAVREVSDVEYVK